MKRRLDLALALVHRPRILFLDEPTTGLDPQSRTALWEEVARLARDDGVTVFLTTQYLEEADVLADRVGIIDHGQDRRRGHARALKAEIGRPTVEAARRPGARASGSRRARALRRAAAPRAPGVAVRSRGGATTSPTSCARSTPGRVAHLQLHQPTLDDVFLAKTGRSLEGAAATRGAERRAGGRRRVSALATQVGEIARRSVVRTLRQPANGRPPLVFPLILLAVNSGGLNAATKLPGFPTDSYLDFALAVPFMQGALFARSTRAPTSRATSRPASSTGSR
jgi:ABC-type glutathione transport system ATPase component